MFYTKFVIISGHRTGSSFLSSRLDSHSNILCFQEMFDNSEDNQILDYHFSAHLNYSVQEATRIRNENPQFFLQEVLFRSYPKVIKAVGFKFHYDHAQAFTTVLDDLRKDRSIKILHLKRQNILDSYISLLKALQTNRWVNRQGKEDTLSGNVRLLVDHNACMEYFLKIENLWLKFDEIFKNHEVLNLEYNAITTGETDIVLQSFLNVPMEPISSPLKKHPLVKRSTAIKNLQELKERFRNTRWIEFFDE